MAFPTLKKLQTAFNQQRTTSRIKSLINAAHKGDTGVITQILEEGIKLDSSYENDNRVGLFGSKQFMMSALMESIRFGQPKATGLLLAKYGEEIKPAPNSPHENFLMFNYRELLTNLTSVGTQYLIVAQEKPLKELLAAATGDKVTLTETGSVEGITASLQIIVHEASKVVRKQPAPVSQPAVAPPAPAVIPPSPVMQALDAVRSQLANGVGHDVAAPEKASFKKRPV